MSAAQPQSNGLPDDANDLRGFYFGQLLRKPLTWVLLGIEVVAAGVAGAVFLGPAIGAAIAAGALLLGLLVVFVVADSRSEDAFFEVYGQLKGMTVHGRSRLPQSTPLLRKGDDRYAERTLEGPLGDGVDGLLALYTYEEESTDSKGNRQTDYYRYTVGIVEVPECAGFAPELYCQRKFGLRALEKLEDAFRRSKQRVKLESAALDERYEIFSHSEQAELAPAPALLPQLRRLAVGVGAGEVRLRAGRRQPLLLRQRSQEEGRGAGHDPRRLHRRGGAPARGVAGVSGHLLPI